MTIKDLARQTGYSVGTVSRVLNGLPHVSDAAREIILQAAKDSGFQLNVNAKQLKQQRGNGVLAICNSKNSYLFANLLSAMQSCMEEEHQTLSVDYIEENENEVLRATQLCRERKPVGVLFLGGSREGFSRDFGWLEIPCVLVTGSASEFTYPNLASVTSDDELTAKLAIDYLAEKGHRRIAVIGSDTVHSGVAKRRYDGCMEAFRRHGIPFNPAQDYVAAYFSLEDGYRAAKELLQKNDDFTALFAFSDVMAIGAMRALWDAGKRVPEDVSVIGVDGLPMGEYSYPRLTTIVQDSDEIARQSVELLKRSGTEENFAVHRVVPVTLVEKESVKQL